MNGYRRRGRSTWPHELSSFLLCDALCRETYSTKALTLILDFHGSRAIKKLNFVINYLVLGILL